MAEVAEFWAIDCALEARFVPDEELERAAAEGRLQQTMSFSMMGTAETYWSRSATAPKAGRDDYAVVPPGREAEDWAWEDRRDDRNVDSVLWEPFRDGQHAAIARALAGTAIDAVIDEVARRLVEAERTKTPQHTQLLDWLIAGAALDPERLRGELAAQRGAPRALVWAIQARLDRSVAGALVAFTESCRMSDYRIDSPRRMDLLRFAVRVRNVA